MQPSIPPPRGERRTRMWKGPGEASEWCYTFPPRRQSGRLNQHSALRTRTGEVFLMVHTLDRIDAAAPGADDRGEAELPTNRLNSTNLQNAPVVRDLSTDSDLDKIDWVRTLTSINT